MTSLKVDSDVTKPEDDVVKVDGDVELAEKGTCAKDQENPLLARNF